MAKEISTGLSVSSQIDVEMLADIANQGFKTIICNRPDNEGAGQPDFADIEKAAKELGMDCHYLPVVSGKVSDDDAKKMGALLQQSQAPVLAYCRTGTRSTMLWALDKVLDNRENLSQVEEASRQAGYNLESFLYRFHCPDNIQPACSHDVVIIGAGTGGLAVTASLLKRDTKLDIAIIEPADEHFYQPAWTLVGRGCYQQEKTKRPMASLIPKKVKHIASFVDRIYPDKNIIVCASGDVVEYKQLIVACGLTLNWDAIEGAEATLGKNGVTSNYHYDLAPYTWELVKNLKQGKAIFTQPPMPIKCAGAPQKAMYLSADYWYRNNHIDNIDIEFCNAIDVLFGVSDYVPELMKYVEKYKAELSFKHKLIKVDGEAKKAWFERCIDGEEPTVIEKSFDMIHITPPQEAPHFIAISPLADAAGWVDVQQDTLQHKLYDNVWALGDISNTPNAKTAAATRTQAPIVANNLLCSMNKPKAKEFVHYNGYGSCPLTVEAGKIVLAEFGYGGKLLPSFPEAVLDGRKATRRAWVLKKSILPRFYWHGMLKGYEWLTKRIPASQ